MVELKLHYFLALLEAVVILAALSGYLFFRLRTTRSRIKQTSTRPPSREESEPRVARLDIVQYLGRELERTSARVGHAKATSDTRLWLDLRAAVLQLEQEWAQQDDRSELFWRALAGRLEQLAKEHGLVPARSVPSGHEEDKAGLADVVERQTHTIAFLKTYINDVLTQIGKRQDVGPVLDQEFEKLEHVNRELRQCVDVLEDENQFLRDQIAALLKLEHDRQKAST